jgi:hypothetical protein
MASSSSQPTKDSAKNVTKPKQPIKAPPPASLLPLHSFLCPSHTPHHTTPSVMAYNMLPHQDTPMLDSKHEQYPHDSANQSEQHTHAHDHQHAIDPVKDEKVRKQMRSYGRLAAAGIFGVSFFLHLFAHLLCFRCIL